MLIADADDNLGVAGKVGGNQRVQLTHSFCISVKKILPNNFLQISFNLITPFYGTRVNHRNNANGIQRKRLELKVPVL